MEIEVGGFGTGEFDWTTNDAKNAYTDEKGLHIVPTITADVTEISESQLLNGYTLNLTSQGICSSDYPSDCVAVSNSTNGTMINPVRSARLTTKGKHNTTYGKVEVVAKVPRGDWLWPAIWYDQSLYPRSGVLSQRGNTLTRYLECTG